MPASAWMLRPWIPVMMLLAVRLRSPDRSHWTLVTAIQLAMHEGHMHAKSPIFPVTYPQPETLTKLSGTTAMQWHIPSKKASLVYTRIYMLQHSGNSPDIDKSGRAKSQLNKKNIDLSIRN